mmetsp:Transcript_80182/g.171696  ORF Transcript_80182/g.171696 Transcript_80182/m.171696 type:complete len:145 (-) Transcript_80182:135-569(-)
MQAMKQQSSKRVPKIAKGKQVTPMKTKKKAAPKKMVAPKKKAAPKTAPAAEKQEKRARAIPGSLLAEELGGWRAFKGCMPADAGPPVAVEGGVLRNLGRGETVFVKDHLRPKERAWLISECRKQVKDRQQLKLSDGRFFHWGRP